MRRIVDLNDFVPMKNLKKKYRIFLKKKKNLFFKHVLHISFVSDNEKKRSFFTRKMKTRR